MSPPATTLPPDNARLGRCEVLEPGWPKMSSAGAVSKKRKKPETKPQSQINKCLNEKRRREQENIYIEELAELISASFADMSSLSVKPDKCAILQETVNQIRHITQEKVSATCDAVQQGEVSSSKPTYLNDDVYGSLVLEALEAFMFVVSPEGKVERVSSNVNQFIKYSQEEVLGKSIYNIIHHGDHARFSSCLLPMSVGWTPLEGQAGGSVLPNSPAATQPSNKVFNCRFLIKPPDDQDETMEEKQQRVSKYETMQIFSKQVPYKGGFGGSEKEEDICEGDQTGPCLMCIARRVPPNEKHMGTPIEQFTMKLDTGGKIIGIDTSGVSSAYSQFLNKDLMNRSIEELCHPHDSMKLNSHLKEALNLGQSTSPIYRLRISTDKHIHVHTKSKLFKTAITHEPDFIMATHSIIGDNDLPLEANSPLSIGGQSSSAVGGPLIASNINGANPRSSSTTSVTSTDLANTITLNNSSAYQSVTLNSSELGFEFEIFPSSTWDLMGNAGNDERGGWERPESRQSLTQAENSPHNPYGGPSQASPAPASGAFTPAASSGNFTPATTAFPFSPMAEGDDPKERKEDSNSEGAESARLRNLLMTKRTPSTDSQGDEARNKILKGLLNQEDEESPPSSQQKTNNMLLKLLNEKSDDDDVEARAGLKKQNELLQQLLKEDESNHEGGSGNEDPLLKSLGFRTGGGSPGESRGRKRPSEEGDDPSVKRGSNSLLDSVPSVPPVSTSATGSSKLWEKNRMLASLLAKQPSTPTTIPPIPASVISATPQDKLPRLKQPPPPPGWSGGTMQQQQQSVTVSQAGRVTQRSPAPVGRTPPSYSQQPSWDPQVSDPLLSDILDQVIEIEPDHVADNNPGLINMINSLDSPSSGASGVAYSNDVINEKLAISAIQKSLMQCETAVKSPPFTNNPVGQQPQAQQHQQGQQFPPPPMYQQRQRFPSQANQLRQNQYNLNQQEQQQQLLLQQQRSKTIQQHKQRLLQLQQQQQLLIPSNAAASSADPGLHNIDSLINNTVAPNVSLQRSASVPDSQLSPVGGFSGVATSGPISAASQISPGQRQPYSPQSFSPVNGGISSFQSGSTQSGAQSAQSPAVQARLSPSALPTFQQAQLSPRVSQSQPGYPSSAGGGQNTTWSQQQASRLSLQQQQNPMLNAQLTQSGGGGYAGGGGRGGFGRGQLPPVRSLTSPGSRQSPFPPELSPTTASSYQFRVQRVPVPPQATTQLPGGLRQYPGGQHNKVGGDVLMSPGYHPQPVVSNMYDTPNQQLLYTDHHQLHLYGTIPRHPTPTHPPGGNNGMTEYVRQELRAMVGARTNASSTAGSPRQQLQLPPSDLEALGLSFEMPPSGVSDSPKMWGNMGDMGSGSPQPGGPPQRNSVEEVSRSGEKASLLQKLLSE